MAGQSRVGGCLNGRLPVWGPGVVVASPHGRGGRQRGRPNRGARGRRGRHGRQVCQALLRRPPLPAAPLPGALRARPARHHPARPPLSDLLPKLLFWTLHSRHEHHLHETKGGKSSAWGAPHIAGDQRNHFHPGPFDAVLLVGFSSVRDSGDVGMRRDVKEEGRKQPEGARSARRRRRGRSVFSLRNCMTLFMVLCFLGVLSLLYSRLWPRLP